jgi:hypothetical protein
MRKGINRSKMAGRASRLPSAGSWCSVSFPHLLSAAIVLACSACSGTTPRVVEVSSQKRLETVEVADQDIFLHDRASQIHLQSELLPANERRQEFFVRWSGTGINLVKFEYRQVNVPDKISEESYVPENRRWNVFEVRGDNFTKGGPVSAWRVSLWKDSKLLAEKKSLLW